MCIVPQEVSESQHRALKMEVSTLQTENKLLKDKYSMAQGKDFNCNRRFFRYLFPSNKMKAALEEFWGGGYQSMGTFWWTLMCCCVLPNRALTTLMVRGISARLWGEWVYHFPSKQIHCLLILFVVFVHNQHQIGKSHDTIVTSSFRGIHHVWHLKWWCGIEHRPQWGCSTIVYNPNLYTVVVIWQFVWLLSQEQMNCLINVFCFIQCQY